MARAADSAGLMEVYGSKISYYTGKFETYLRYRSIPYELHPTVAHRRKLIAGVGIVQMPVVRLADGRWMTDTTPMIAWLESRQSAPSIYPADPALKFVAMLIEDYGDEWLWRPAMHYRWSYRRDRQCAADALYDELLRDTRPIPRFIGRNVLKIRQFGGFVRGDGVTSRTRFHVDRTYLTALDRMQAVLERRPFLLGGTPTIADFGMMGPMLRHFGQDPTPAELMRERAPAVYEWVARMWNAKPGDREPELIVTLDRLLAEFLVEIAETHLAQLRQNAEAYGQGRARYDQVIQDCRYTNVPVSRYRVWCLENLRRSGAELDLETRTQLRGWLTSAAQILWDDADVASSAYDTERVAPFNRAINVFGTGMPPR
jgi:glutathione S-transferase